MYTAVHNVVFLVFNIASFYDHHINIVLCKMIIYNVRTALTLVGLNCVYSIKILHNNLSLYSIPHPPCVCSTLSSPPPPPFLLCIPLSLSPPSSLSPRPLFHPPSLLHLSSLLLRPHHP